MLVIRAQQMAVLSFEADAEWCDQQLANIYPAFAAAPVADRRKWTSEGLERALKLNIERAEYLQFLCFEQTYSPGCLEQPSFEWARRILAEPKSSAERMKRLRRETIRRLLELEARQEAEKALAEEEEPEQAT